MTTIFNNAKFGTRLQTKDGGMAIYLAHILYNDTHKIFVQGYERPLIYLPDGTRKGGGRYANKTGMGLDIDKILD
jgi:hypothetical protein